MSKQKIIFLAVGIVVGFLVGFFVADSANRKERDALRAENARLKAGSQSSGEAAAGATGQQASLNSEDSGRMPLITEEQMRAAIQKADANPSDASIQKMSGQVLYIYATQTGSPAVMPDAARILRRAHAADPKDYDSLVLLGNVLFIVARRSGEPARLTEAREAYGKALALKPDDLTVRTSLGLTYFYDKPSDPQRAITEYRKSLAQDPRHEMTLQSIAAALIAVENYGEAQQMLDRLEQVQPSNQQLPNLRAQLAQKRNASKEKD